MSVLLWGILALVLGFLVLWLAGLRVMPKGPPLPEDVELPATPMQQTARWSLLVGLILAIAAAAVLVTYGAEHTFDTRGVRMVFTLLVLGGILVPAVATAPLKRRAKLDSASMDERDHTILERAPAIQGLATVVTLAVWVVGLTEQFHDAGAVPVSYLYILFWSCLMIYVLGLPVGILIGYRRV
jgi:hypothetical protein